MESKDLKVVLIVACISIAMATSSYIIGKSIKEGLLYQGSDIRSAGSDVAGAIVNDMPTQKKLELESDVLNESQAAAFLRISQNDVTYLLKNSKAMDGKGIPHFKVGNTTLFSKTALTKWVSTIAENGFEY